MLENSLTKCTQISNQVINPGINFIEKKNERKREKVYTRIII